MKKVNSTRVFSATLLTLGCLTLAACGGGSSASDGTVGGIVSNLASGESVVLQNNGGDNLSLNTNGPFTFATRIVSLGAFRVTVLTQPVPQTCTVARFFGVIPTDGNTVNTVVVNCQSNTLSGTVTGLASGESVVVNNASLSSTSNAAGAYSIPGLLPQNTAYNLTIATSPSGKTCTFDSNSSASLSGSTSSSGNSIPSTSNNTAFVGSVPVIANVTCRT